MEKYLRMVFKTDQDKKVSLRVAVPRDYLDAMEVKAIMDLIIAKNIIKLIITYQQSFKKLYQKNKKTPLKRVVLLIY